MLPFMTMTASAKPVWQDVSLSALYGEHYAVVDAQQTTVTLEYAAKIPYTDVFFFMDRQRGGNDSKSTYFELSPRFSLSELSGKRWAMGPIKDVLIATTWEAGNQFDNFLYGIGLALNLPYTNYANLNLYRVHNEQQKDDYQMTVTYAIPLNVGQAAFLIDGFLDWSSAAVGDHANELNWTTQYKWNIGPYLAPETRLYLGVEHSIWCNKYGRRDQDQHDLSLLVKYHF